MSSGEDMQMESTPYHPHRPKQNTLHVLQVECGIQPRSVARQDDDDVLSLVLHLLDQRVDSLLPEAVLTGQFFRKQAFWSRELPMSGSRVSRFANLDTVHISIPIRSILLCG